MPDHYYTEEPLSESAPTSVHFSYRGISLTCMADAGVFSKTELDRGTDILLRALPPQMCGCVLDLGCGWGPIGLAVKAVWPACTVTLCDINRRALDLAQANAARNRLDVEVLQSDGLDSLSGRMFDHIITNPPIRAGKKVIYRFFADAAAQLSDSGDLTLVIRKQQGAPSAFAYLRTLYRSVEIIEREAGYHVIRCAEPVPVTLSSAASPLP